MNQSLYIYSHPPARETISKGLKLLYLATFPVFGTLWEYGTLACMEFTDKDLEELSRIWQEEFHEELPAPRARQCASALLELYAVLARPLPAEIQPT